MTLYGFTTRHTGIYDTGFVHKELEQPITYEMERGTLWKNIGVVLEHNDGRILIGYRSGVTDRDRKILCGQAEDLITGRTNTVTDPGFMYTKLGWQTSICVPCDNIERAQAIEHAIQQIPTLITA